MPPPGLSRGRAGRHLGGGRAPDRRKRISFSRHEPRYVTLLSGRGRRGAEQPDRRRRAISPCAGTGSGWDGTVECRPGGGPCNPIAGGVILPTAGTWPERFRRLSSGRRDRAARSPEAPTSTQARGVRVRPPERAGPGGPTTAPDSDRDWTSTALPSRLRPFILPPC